MTQNSNAGIVFTPSVKAAQEARGSRAIYARMDPEHPKEVTEDLARFIAERDSFYIGTASKSGQPYIQHRGGTKGFLKVLDATTLAFGDVAGNAQYISVGNLDENDRAFLFLMDYPNRRRIKIWGTAQVIEDDDELLQRVRTDDEDPQRVFLFHISAWNQNCPKNIQPRWTAEQVGERIISLTEELDQLRRENRSLKRQLKQQKEQQ